MNKSPIARELSAIAAESFKAGEKLVLVQDLSVMSARTNNALVARHPLPNSYHHGIALNDAAYGETVRFEEATFRTEIPKGDILKDFTPVLFNDWNYGLFLLPIQKCPICGRTMMSRSDVFDKYTEFTQDKQMTQAGIVHIGQLIPGSDRHACEVCTREGRVTFICAICKESRSSDQFHEEVCEEPICTVCYETKSAKEYEESTDKLYDEYHRYDYD